MKDMKLKKALNNIIKDWRLFTEKVVEDAPAKEDLISDMWGELEALEERLINESIFADVSELANRVNYMKHCLTTNEKWLAEEIEEEEIEEEIEDDWDESSIIITIGT